MSKQQSKKAKMGELNELGIAYDENASKKELETLLPPVEEEVEEVEEVKHPLIGKSIGGKEIVSAVNKGDRVVVTDIAGCTYPLSQADIEEYVK